MGELIIYLVFFIIGIAISVAIMRAVFMIPTIVANLRMQTRMLEEIAKKNGVEPDLLDGIKNQYS